MLSIEPSSDEEDHFNGIRHADGVRIVARYTQDDAREKVAAVSWLTSKKSNAPTPDPDSSTSFTGFEAIELDPANPGR